ncbi:MAG: alpha/beta hydrolase [Rhodospirillaceae bacterium]|nr:alpha/beta hydrolase [Rhodospirillaceae bacterium]
MITTPDMLWNGPARAALTVVLAHGAGAPMDTPFMTFFAEGLAERGFGVGRFEFPYMAARRTGKRKPPDREPMLLDCWRNATAGLKSPFVIGGKSMGGRMASLIADDVGAAGLLCLGYPFVGMGGKENPKRTAHLAVLKTPALICQGTRDPMGNKSFVTALPLSRKIRLSWAEDGDHDLKPRKASGLTHAENLAAALDAAGRFLEPLAAAKKRDR